MPKILRPYTIIPPHLYVHRNADRQVKHIIEDMGRPGYVLVSRQMGKTNLLLNAKRELESSSDIFVYVDLSNPYDSAKSCFENIIDLAVETNSIRFEEAYTNIRERRKELSNTPPHKQHTNELRILLKAISGKLVIILDEIDALTKTSYSDQIFAQIRSIYFSRINFPELERLTYLLSGVIEPTEIIKDPKISPFNIGQKIFLNDFTKVEFLEFVEVSGLSIENKVTDRIFHWTSGNPRMTWDICSEVENHISNGFEITEGLIDKIVSHIYLTTYDKPPIDNIRELVINDRDIRKAIIEVEYQKGKQISDKIKSKLYLAGIINYYENDIKLKNEIIRESLSLDWIRSIEEAEKGLVKIALEYYEKGDYESALKNFEKYLEGNEFEENDSSVYYYTMAYASYRRKLFSKSLTYLDQTEFNREDNSKLYYKMIHLKGLVNYYMEQYDDSLVFFKEIIDSGRKDEDYLRSLLNYGSTFLKSEKTAHIIEAKRTFEDIINEVGLDSAKLKERFIGEIKSIAYFNLGQIALFEDDRASAKECFHRALKIGEDNIKPKIFLALIEIDPNNHYLYCEQFIDLIVQNKVQPSDLDPENPIGFNYDEFKEIIIVTYLKYRNSLFEKLRVKLILLNQNPLSEQIYELAMYSANNNHWDTSKELLDDLYLNLDNTELSFSQKIRFNIIKYTTYFSGISQSANKHLEYAKEFIKVQTDNVDAIDIENFANLIYILNSQKKYDEGLFYSSAIKAVRNFASAKDMVNYLVIYHLELNAYISRGDKKRALLKANEILEFAQNDIFKHVNTNLLSETGYEIIISNAEKLVNPKNVKRQPIKVEKSYSRNEIVKVRYKDGTIIEAKYKKIISDLENGDCLILN